MRLKTYRAGSVVQAMALVRAELGADALILSTRRNNGMVEIAACLDAEDEDEDHDLPAALVPAAHPRRTPPPDGHAAAARTVGPPPLTPPPGAQWLPQPRPNGPLPAPAGALAWHGIPAALAEQLDGQDLAEALATLLRFDLLPTGTDAPLLVIGPPGAGKTLTIARLATRLVLSGQMPLVISADGRRAGAAEELAAYTRLLGIELIVANKAASITRALQWRKENTPVLIDSPGVNPFDASQIQTVCGLAAAVGAMPVLILAAGQDAQEAAEHAEIFAASDIHHMVPTRLDLARRLGAIVAAAHAGSLILSEAGTGPGATEGLTPLTPAILAARLSQMPPFPQQAHDARLIR
jgi:flagellar biosynthesis protein FlhF